MEFACCTQVRATADECSLPAALLFCMILTCELTIHSVSPDAVTNTRVIALHHPVRGVTCLQLWTFRWSARELEQMLSS